MGSSVIRLGPLRLSAYGLCAAVGLVGALWLSVRTARSVGLQAVDLWDAGFFALGAAFVVSRTLLVIRNWDAFRRYPMLVLALPSLSYWAMGITAVAVGVYLRRKKMPLLAVMDAWAPCAALLAVFLEVGHWFEGTDAGMPWGWHGGLVPVQLMGAIASLWLCWFLLRIFRREKTSGRVAGIGLLDAGILCFFLTMIEQPSTVTGNEWLDPSQWIALAALVAGSLILSFRPNPPLNREEAALILERFVLGGGGPFDHEALEYTKSTDPLIVEARDRFLGLQSEFPTSSGYCSEQGSEVLLDYVRRLRSDGE